MSSDYPRKYWWVILIAVPLVAALIGILPQFWQNGSSSSSPIHIQNTEFSGDMHFANIEVIVQEYQQITGKALTDKNLLTMIEQGVNLVRGEEYAAAIPVFKELAKQVNIPSVQNNLGVLYATNKDYAGARQAYRNAIAKQPENQTVQLNLGLLDQREGKVEEAKKHFAKAPDLKDARNLKDAIEKNVSEGTAESEPNNQLNAPNSISLATPIQGIIADKSDLDGFAFTTPEVYRDWFQVKLNNHSDRFQPYLQVRTESKQMIGDRKANNLGQDLSYEFVGGPDRKYLVLIGGRYDTTGSYDLMATPLNRYDSYEPNDTKNTPRSIPFGESIQANIMDKHDVDYYIVTTAEDSSKLAVVISNPSALQPYLQLFTASKKRFGESKANNTGQDLTYEFDGNPHADYIVWVGGRYDTTGDYQLTVRNK